jgi:hypothetical protein
VRFSRRDLETAAASMATSDGVWQTTIAASRDGVLVRIPVLTEDAQNLLAKFPEAIAMPLVSGVK